MILEQPTKHMKELTILLRHLNGENEVAEAHERAREHPGVLDFPEFLRQVGLGTFECFWELGQALKVPYAQLVNCDLIESSAQDNVREYVRTGRISPQCLEFMKAQHGEAGTKNCPPRDDNPEYQKDNCG